MNKDLIKNLLNRFLGQLTKRLKNTYGVDLKFEINSLNYFRSLENNVFLHVFIDTFPEEKSSHNVKFLQSEIKEFLKDVVGIEDIHGIIVELDKRPLYNIDEEKLPFKEKKGKNLRIREFSERVDSEELKWHFDDEDRMVKTLHKTDWMIQFDNKVPQKLSENREIFIPKGVYHRLIKGTGDLKVKIRLF